MSNEGIRRTAPATPSLLIIWDNKLFSSFDFPNKTKVDVKLVSIVFCWHIVRLYLECFDLHHSSVSLCCELHTSIFTVKMQDII